MREEPGGPGQLPGWATARGHPDGSHHAHAAATPSTSQHVDPVRVPHQLRPRPLSRHRRWGLLHARGGGWVSTRRHRRRWLALASSDHQAGVALRRAARLRPAGEPRRARRDGRSCRAASDRRVGSRRGPRPLVRAVQGEGSDMSRPEAASRRLLHARWDVPARDTRGAARHRPAGGVAAPALARDRRGVSLRFEAAQSACACRQMRTLLASRIRATKPLQPSNE